MAILSEIRKRSWILIAIVALGLVAFLIDPNTLIGNFKQVNGNNYGEVNGEIITRDEYEAFKLIASQQNQGRLPDSQLDSQAWESAVNNKIAQTHAEKAGIDMNEEILFAYYPELKKQIDQIKAQASSGDPNAQEQLMNVPILLKAESQRLQGSMYNSLLTTFLTTNKVEIEAAQKDASTQANAQWVKVDYNTYNAKHPTKVSDLDLQAYIDEHKLLFKKEATTNFQFAFFPSSPSAQDKSIFEKNIQAIINGGVEYDPEGIVLDSIPSFKTATNDSAYVASYSSQGFDPNFYGIQEIQQGLSPDLANWVKTASIGAMFGPYNKGNYTALTKISKKQAIDSVASSHILIGFKGSVPNASRSKEEAQKQAQEILAKAQADPKSFAVLAQQFSDDKNSAVQGGSVGWVTNQTPFVQEFKDYVLKNPVGSIGLVESQFGFHIIDITDKKVGEAYQLATVVKENRPSKATEEKLYAIANQFLASVKDKSLNDFVSLASKDKFQQRSAENVTRFQGVIEGLQTDKDPDVIAWSFNGDTKPGDTSIFNTTNGDYIVVRLTSKSKKGLAQPQEIKSSYELVVRNQKIAKELMPKLKGKNLDNVVAEFGGVKQNGSLIFGQFVEPTLGNEPKVVGAAFGLPERKISHPIEGNAGVFLVQLDSKTANPTPIAPQMVKQQAEQSNKGMSNFIFQSLRQEADILDERGKIFMK